MIGSWLGLSMACPAPLRVMTTCCCDDNQLLQRVVGHLPCTSAHAGHYVCACSVETSEQMTKLCWHAAEFLVRVRPCYGQTLYA